MQDLEYIKALELLHESFPELQNYKGRFYIENGELYHVHAGSGYPDMNMLQKFINQTLGQKAYRVEYIAYKEVYARSIEEANEFVDMEPRPKPTRVNTKLI